MGTNNRRPASREPRRLPKPATGSGQERLANDRKASAADRDARLYDRKRSKLSRQRAEEDRKAFDPAPVVDDDWTVEEEDSDALTRIRPPTVLNDTLRELVRRRGWDERLRGASAWSRWPEIVGPELASRCEPLRLSRGVLTVRAENQVWATQLKYMLPQLRTNVEQALGERTVKDIKVVVGPLEGRREPEQGSDR